MLFRTRHGFFTSRPWRRRFRSGPKLVTLIQAFGGPPKIAQRRAYEAAMKSVAS